MILGILLAITVTAFGAWLLLRQRPSKDMDFLVETRLPRITVVAIYCLDCAGEELLPRKTFLTGDGRCSKCYGRSYAIAAMWAPAIKTRLQRELRTAQARERTKRIEQRVV